MTTHEIETVVEVKTSKPELDTSDKSTKRIAKRKSQSVMNKQSKVVVDEIETTVATGIETAAETEELSYEDMMSHEIETVVEIKISKPELDTSDKSTNTKLVCNLFREKFMSSPHLLAKIQSMDLNQKIKIKSTMAKIFVACKTTVHDQKIILIELGIVGDKSQSSLTCRFLLDWCSDKKK